MKARQGMPRQSVTPAAIFSCIGDTGKNARVRGEMVSSSDDLEVILIEQQRLFFQRLGPLLQTVPCGRSPDFIQVLIHPTAML